MKKVLLVLALATFGMNVNAQLEVNKTKTETVWRSSNSSQSLKHFVTETGEFYAFYYKNLDYKTITDMKYLKLENKDEVLQFMDLILGAMNVEESTNLKLGGELVVLGDMSGDCIILTTNSHTIITEKQVNKIKESLNN